MTATTRIYNGDGGSGAADGGSRNDEVNLIPSGGLPTAGRLTRRA